MHTSQHFIIARSLSRIKLRSSVLLTYDIVEIGHCHYCVVCQQGLEAQMSLNNGTPMTELRDVTCLVGSHCYLLPDTSERTPPEGWHSFYLAWRDVRLSWPS